MDNICAVCLPKHDVELNNYMRSLLDHGCAKTMSWYWEEDCTNETQEALVKYTFPKELYYAVRDYLKGRA